LHASTKWPSAEVDTELWTYAVNLAVFQWNHTPRRNLHYLCPEEAFTGIKKSSSTSATIKQLFHPFGCPVLVLKTALQNGQSLPKFDPRCRMGVYLGHSSEHVSNVALVLNPKTGIISNQYHLVFDDKFETILSTDTSKTGQLALWTDISKRINAVESDPTISFTPDVFNPSPLTNIYNLNDMPTPESAAHDEDEPHLANGASPSPPASPATLPANHNNNNPPNSGHSKPSKSSVSQHIKSSCSRHPYLLDPLCKSNHTSHTTNPKRRSNRKRKRSQKVQDAISQIHAMAAAFASSSRHLPFSERIEQLLNLSSLNSGEINDIDPLAFAASANPNILSHREATKAEDVEQFLESMQEELERMDDNEIYEEVLRSSVPKAQKILRAVWSHRRKTTPIGIIYRHRSRLCVDGSCQQHGIDYHDTYSPVVSWTTVRLLLILSKLLNLSSHKVDYVQAFPQAPLEGEDVYMELPAGYTVKSANKNVVLKLKKNLYGLKQAAYNWHELLKSGLLKLGFKQSQVEPCLFMKQDIVCLLYVDDTLFFSTDDKLIDKHISALQSLQFELTDEGDIDTFLGVKLTNNPDGSITMTQPAMTDQVLKALGLTNDSKSHKTPATSPLLHAHPDGAERTENWNYKSVIGMLIYLAKNTRPDIEYAVHQCARFQLNPKKAHENAVKRIGRYLLGTRDKGITFTPKLEEINSVECFIDADFAGNYTKEETSHDPDSVKSRTGCIIRFAGCPITWFS
jgi:Reverse transcriptase (RNA-dependent DNA polymerase).